MKPRLAGCLPRRVCVSYRNRTLLYRFDHNIECDAVGIATERSCDSTCLGLLPDNASSRSLAIIDIASFRFSSKCEASLEKLQLGCCESRCCCRRTCSAERNWPFDSQSRPRRYIVVPHRDAHGGVISYHIPTEKKKLKINRECYTPDSR